MSNQSQGQGPKPNEMRLWTDQELCDRWNERYPIGTPVRVRKDSGAEVFTQTRSAATVLGGHSAVIWLEEISGAYSLRRVTAVNVNGQSSSAEAAQDRGEAA